MHILKLSPDAKLHEFASFEYGKVAKEIYRTTS